MTTGNKITYAQREATRKRLKAPQWNERSRGRKGALGLKRLEVRLPEKDVERFRRDAQRLVQLYLKDKDLC